MCVRVVMMLIMAIWEGTDSFLRVFGVLYCCIIAARLDDSHWSDEPHFFTVYLEKSTWNDAREYCKSSGKQLLSVINETDLEFWTKIMNHTRLKEHRSDAGVYWTGLHAPDQGVPDSYFWDDCSVGTLFGTDLYDLQVTDHQCVAMSTITEALFGGGMKGFTCNETHPFICMKHLNESDCVESCDELAVLTEQEVCDSLCEDIACHAAYISHLQMCHVTPSVYASPARFTLCYLPSVDFTPNVCASESDDLVINTTDTNVNVTDTICMIQQSDFNDTAFTEKCSCLCEKLWTFMSAPPPEVVNLTVEEKVDIIVQELTVDKKNTTLSQRKFVSVMDYRPSSIGLGIVAGVIILSVIGVIIIMDVSTIWNEIKTFLLKILSMMNPPRSRNKNPFAEHDGKTDVTHDVFTPGDCLNTENNTESSGDTAINNISGVGWFLRERFVYGGKTPENTTLELAPTEDRDKNIRKPAHSTLTSEV